ncbi:hypothetical protein [Streptomyces sp. NPDC091212]|uniref:AAA family ATPase n=1 Tax=Streptomyces sp. NPDC091212 TaxID=3155191 RepID=UPI00341E1031
MDRLLNQFVGRAFGFFRIHRGASIFIGGFVRRPRGWDPKANPRDAQLIFTTHDATLLGSEVLDRPLGRDQVWITAKDRTGATELYPLTAARPADGESLERGYLRGRYGGVPRVSAGEIAREVSWQEAKATA